jgi:hypothetical protein
VEYKNGWRLAEDILITKTFVQSNSIYFKHYFYEMNHFDFVIQKRSSIKIDQSLSTIEEYEILGKEYPNFEKAYISKTSDCKFRVHNYYYITYKDAYNNISKRIIRIKQLFIYIKDIEKFKENYLDLNAWNHNEDISSVNYSYHETGKIFIHLEGESIPNNTLPKTIFEDKNVEIMLNTNCLLRKGKIRNFKINGLMEVREIVNGSDFFEG